MRAILAKPAFVILHAEPFLTCGLARPQENNQDEKENESCPHGDLPSQYTRWQRRGETTRLYEGTAPSDERPVEEASTAKSAARPLAAIFYHRGNLNAKCWQW
jgi:hypothetical protein